MHEDFDINIEELSKIEGHTDLDVSVRNGKVVDSKFRINENKRFFTNAVIGKPALGVHQIVSRICGTCSIAHLMGCIKCVENAFEVVPSEQTDILRELLFYGLNIRDHAMHLYLFCLPDVFGKDSILEFEDHGYQHELIHKAFEIKGTGNDLSILVGGRAVHPPLPQVGGFMKVPSNEEAKKMAEKLRSIRESAIEFVDIFDKCDFNYETSTNYVALKNDKFSYLKGHLFSSDGVCISPNNFRDHFTKTVIPYSQAPGFQYKGKSYVVGAIARLNINKGNLQRDTEKDMSKYLKKFPTDNVFYNNLAQAIEIIHCIDASIEILETTEFKKEEKLIIKPKESVGVGVIEAPRGTLYYNLKIDSQGKIKFADLVIPTSQNQIKMNQDIGGLVQKKIDMGMKKEDIPLEIEKLVRAYDPCMSCATHFLKVNWK